MTEHSVRTGIEIVDLAMRSNVSSPASEPQLTTTYDVHEAIKGLKVNKAPGPNVIPNGELNDLPKRTVSLLANIFNAVFHTHYFLQTWMHDRVFSILKPGEDPALSSSYRPISLLETIGKLFEKILLTGILHVVNERGMMRNEQFVFRPRHSTPLQLASLVERITKISAKRSSPAKLSATWPKPSIPSGLNA